MSFNLTVYCVDYWAKRSSLLYLHMPDSIITTADNLIKVLNSCYSLNPDCLAQEPLHLTFFIEVHRDPHVITLKMSNYIRAQIFLMVLFFSCTCSSSVEYQRRSLSRSILDASSNHGPR